MTETRARLLKGELGFELVLLRHFTTVAPLPAVDPLPAVNTTAAAGARAGGGGSAWPAPLTGHAGGAASTAGDAAGIHMEVS